MGSGCVAQNFEAFSLQQKGSKRNINTKSLYKRNGSMSDKEIEKQHVVNS